MEDVLINRDFRGDNRPRETRINERVRAREVRLIDEEGQMVGVMPSGQALALARERDLDLVEVSPMAVPPVCKLMDYGRFKYEQAKKESEARKHQRTTELKEIRMRPRTDDHDLMVKVRKIEEFLADGDKVKVGVIFRGREMAHPELGRQLLERVIAELKGAALVERAPSMEGKMVSLIVSRAPGWEPAKRRASAPQARAGGEAALPPEGDGQAAKEAALPVAGEPAPNDLAAAPTPPVASAEERQTATPTAS
ncbi:MAG: translation initiation factor IF-3 [Ktedonobacterales bacterium]|nr:translation initiation factor IF-3 [Ktedonobacterales bacterium]